ncbi:E3 ubiquitin-protein like [Abeliophyllum distichum]|uniref:E3 ubiquitin-protein like n=1 Tax=Abeliophyllum distichum TaxID=126358 RepID=A0ABD1R083_9LAMI
MFVSSLSHHNDSVLELSKGAQREMVTGIAGLSRMIERFDFTSEPTKHYVPLSSYTIGISNSPQVVESFEDDTIVQSINQITEETDNYMKSTPSRTPINLQQHPTMHTSFSCSEFKDISLVKFLFRSIATSAISAIAYQVLEEFELNSPLKFLPQFH